MELKKPGKKEERKLRSGHVTYSILGLLQLPCRQQCKATVTQACVFGGEMGRKGGGDGVCVRGEEEEVAFQTPERRRHGCLSYCAPRQHVGGNPGDSPQNTMTPFDKLPAQKDCSTQGCLQARACTQHDDRALPFVSPKLRHAWHYPCSSQACAIHPTCKNTGGAARKSNKTGELINPHSDHWSRSVMTNPSV